MTDQPTDQGRVKVRVRGRSKASMAFRVVISFWAIVFTTLAAIAVVVIANHDRRMDRGLAIAQANAQANVQATAHVASQEFSVTP